MSDSVQAVSDELTALTPSKIDKNSLLGRFEYLEAELNGELVERRHEIFGALLTLVSRSTMFMLGEPGIAKSFLVNRLMLRIAGANHFDILMSKFTQPEEIFGPPSLKALEDDRFEHLIDGYLPTADTATLDEGFKANSAILNSLLWLINERKYRHGRNVIEAPLSALFLMSNELPADDSLNALFDRLLLRYQVHPIRDQGSFLSMMTNAIDPTPAPVLTWDDVCQAQREAAAVEIPQRVQEAYVDLRRALVSEHSIELSDRRWVQSKRIVQAAAWFDGCTRADIEHMGVLEHVLWISPEQRDNVSEEVLKRAAPLEREAGALLAGIRELEEQLDDISTEDERMRLGNEVHGKIQRAAEQLADLQKRASTGRRRNTRVAEVKDKLTIVTDRVLAEVFHLEPGASS